MIHPVADLFVQLAVGTVMIGLTVMIQAITLDFVIKRVGRAEGVLRRLTGLFWKPVMSGAVVLAVFTIQVLNIWLWAFLYLGLGCAPLEGIPDALYFATVTYTTLGYGDIVLEPSCRMLGGVEASNGFLLFGWGTAFIFEVISQLYRREARSI